MNKFGGREVLQRAAAIIEAGPLPKSHSEHGEWCPYCALALAKGFLDEAFGVGDIVEVIAEAGFFGRHESDEPLHEALAALGKIPQPFTRSATLAAFRAALEQPA